jgi:hypothetical protein
VIGPRSTPEGSAEVIARFGFAGPRSTPEGSAEVEVSAWPGRLRQLREPRLELSELGRLQLVWNVIRANLFD